MSEIFDDIKKSIARAPKKVKKSVTLDEEAVKEADRLASDNGIPLSSYINYALIKQNEAAAKASKKSKK